jgi:hypothetical protein
MSEWILPAHPLDLPFGQNLTLLPQILLLAAFSLFVWTSENKSKGFFELKFGTFAIYYDKPFLVALVTQREKNESKGQRMRGRIGRPWTVGLYPIQRTLS